MYVIQNEKTGLMCAQNTPFYITPLISASVQFTQVL